MVDDKIPLTRFVSANWAGQAVAVNPTFVRCLVSSASGARPTVSIDIGDPEGIKVEGDLESVATSLGFTLTEHNKANRP